MMNLADQNRLETLLLAHQRAQEAYSSASRELEDLRATGASHHVGEYAVKRRECYELGDAVRSSEAALVMNLLPHLPEMLKITQAALTEETCRNLAFEALRERRALRYD